MKTPGQIIEQEIRKVIQSVALHGYDLVLAEKDIFKAVQRFYHNKLRIELIAYDKYLDEYVDHKRSELRVNTYLKRKYSK